MNATRTTSEVAEQREALALLTKLFVLQAALTERLVLLIENRDHPAVDVEAWDYLIEEAKLQRAQMATRIETLRTRLGFDFTPQIH